MNKAIQDFFPVQLLTQLLLSWIDVPLHYRHLQLGQDVLNQERVHCTLGENGNPGK